MQNYAAAYTKNGTCFQAIQLEEYQVVEQGQDSLMYLFVGYPHRPLGGGLSLGHA